MRAAPSISEQRHGNLSTLNEDGSRRWIKPRPSRGRFWRSRRALGALLIAVFTLVPYIKMSGMPLILLDIVSRRFTLFGTTFLPTDTLIMALFVIGVFVLFFLLTALLGRVWCGWACPQTVYMEFLFRPIERLLYGEPGRAPRRLPGAAFIKYTLYVLVSMFLAHTFLAYFVGVTQLRRWVTGSPLEHPTAFVVMAVVTGLMLLDFGFFREQICIVMCPYGRFQSVMLDRASLIVGYDRGRGEPRGKAGRRDRKDGAAEEARLALPVLAFQGVGAVAPVSRALGDCIDCRMCVNACPTGIDIREGLQMECLHCAQCIDACDAVMDKVGKPRGLVKFCSQAELEGEARPRRRVRVVVYPLLLLMIFGLMVGIIAKRAPADVTLLRGRGMVFTELPTGEVSNTVRVKITNRTQSAGAYRLALAEPPRGARVVADDFPLEVGPGEQRTAGATVILPRASFVPSGVVEVSVEISDASGFKTRAKYRLLGPMNTREPKDHHERVEHAPPGEGEGHE